MEPEETYFRPGLPLSPEAEEAYQDILRMFTLDWGSGPEAPSVALSPDAVACPARTCGAAAGEPCVTSTESTRPDMHGLRWLALFRGPLVRCPSGSCSQCWYTGWVPAGS